MAGISANKIIKVWYPVLKKYRFIISKVSTYERDGMFFKSDQLKMSFVMFLYPSKIVSGPRLTADGKSGFPVMKKFLRKKNFPRNRTGIMESRKYFMVFILKA